MMDRGMVNDYGITGLVLIYKAPFKPRVSAKLLNAI